MAQGSATLWQSLTRTKPVERLVSEGGHGEGADLRRSMGIWQLTMLSVGATLGTGIFVILGDAAPVAGPAVILSFVLAGVTALLSALSYAELAGTIPVSGSSYSYTYATMGELVAWICGCCLLLEYAVSVAAVAVGWGQYLNEFATGAFGVAIPDALSAPPGQGGVFNVTALVIVLLAGALLLRGVSESARVNTAMTVFKIIILVFFCVVAFTGIKEGNLAPFAPLGLAGISAAGAQVFFSFIGFDAASTAGEEARDPRRDLPRAIMLAMLIVTAVYVLVALAAVGAVDYRVLGQSEASLAMVLETVTGGFWAPLLLSVGAIVAIASVVLTVMYGQTRILFTMARDGLIPQVFARVNPRTRVPSANIIMVSGFIAVLAALVPLGQLAEATSIGTLFAFALVNVSVILLRRTRPNLRRGFRAPFYPVTPILGALFCLYLMSQLAAVTWLVFVLWIIAGLIFYAAYGRRRSRLAGSGGDEETTTRS